MVQCRMRSRIASKQREQTTSALIKFTEKMLPHADSGRPTKKRRKDYSEASTLSQSNLASLKSDIAEHLKSVTISEYAWKCGGKRSSLTTKGQIEYCLFSVEYAKKINSLAPYCFFWASVKSLKAVHEPIYRRYCAVGKDFFLNPLLDTEVLTAPAIDYWSLPSVVQDWTQNLPQNLTLRHWMRLHKNGRKLLRNTKG